MERTSGFEVVRLQPGPGQSTAKLWNVGSVDASVTELPAGENVQGELHFAPSTVTVPDAPAIERTSTATCPPTEPSGDSTDASSEECAGASPKAQPASGGTIIAAMKATLCIGRHSHPGDQPRATSGPTKRRQPFTSVF
jgi:hypothetical protein